MANFIIRIEFTKKPSWREYEKLQILMAEYGFRQIVPEVDTTRKSAPQITVYVGAYKNADSYALRDSIDVAIRTHIKTEVKSVFPAQVMPAVIPSPPRLF